MDINRAKKELEAEVRRLLGKSGYTFVERLIDLIQAERDELRKIDPTTYRNATGYDGSTNPHRKKDRSET